VLARSSKEAATEAGKALKLGAFGARPLKGPTGEQPLALIVEGKLKSAFGAAAAKTPSRVLIVSSSRFLANPFSLAGKPPPLPPQLQMMGDVGGDEQLKMIGQVYSARFSTRSIVSLMNTVDWLGGENDLSELRADLLLRDAAAK